MTQTITVIYENGVLRPLKPLSLPEHTPLQIAIELPVVTSNDADEQRRQFQAVLIAAGVITAKTNVSATAQALSAQERATLADRLAVPGAKPLSEVIIEEREGR